MKHGLFPFLLLIIFACSAIPVSAHNTASTFDQEHFMFRDDDGTEVTATGYSASNLGVDTNISTDFAVGQAFRLRMGLLKNNNGDLSLTTTPRLEFKAGGSTGSCTTDTWTVVPVEASCGSNAICQATSANFTDGTATTRQVDATHTRVGGDMIETGGSANSATYGTGTSTDHAEWEWMLDTNNAALGTTYTFRLTSGGTPYTNYTVCPTLTTDAAPTPTPTITPTPTPPPAGGSTFTQNRYRWYVDNDSTNPTVPWPTSGISLPENTSIPIIPVVYDPPSTTQELRLRINLMVNTSNLSVGQKQFSLQFKEGTDGSCTTGSWTTITTGQTWQYATSSVTDGEDITESLSTTNAGKGQEYVKSDPSHLNHVAANTSEQIEYDFHIVGSLANTATKYSFRLIESTGTILDAYNNCPTLTTEPGNESLMRHGNLLIGGEEHGFYWAD
jgi:hypothetical protein